MKEKEITDPVLITEALMQLKAMQSVLIKKGILTKNDLDIELSEIVTNITKTLLQKANVKEEDIREFVNKFKLTVE